MYAYIHIYIYTDTYAYVHTQVLNEQRSNLFEIIGCEDRPDELAMLRSALLQINEQLSFVASRLASESNTRPLILDEHTNYGKVM